MMSDFKKSPPALTTVTEPVTALPASPEVSRRQILGTVLATSSFSLLSLSPVGPVQAADNSSVIFSNIELGVLSAFTDRIIPADENGPGALAAGVINYINRALNSWLELEQEAIKQSLDQINKFALARYNDNFVDLTVSQQEGLMTAMEANQAEGFINAQQVFNRLRRLTLEGMFSDPYYGGNQQYIGWDLIAYPGAVMASSPEMQVMGGRLPPLHTSAYGGDYDGD